MESVRANNCRSVFASSTPTSKVTFNPCPERLRVGIRYITTKIEALGSYNEDRYLGYQDFRKLRFGTLAMFSANFDALAPSGTARKLQVSLYSTSEALCGEILAF